MASSWGASWGSAWGNNWGDIGAPAPAAGKSSRRRSISRRRQPRVVGLDGRPIEAPKLVPVRVEVVAHELSSDRANAKVSLSFLPIAAFPIVAVDVADIPQISVKVTGLGYDEDDLEVLAMLMGG